MDIIDECSDPGVARVKFKWWQEEIERLSHNEPRHPVTRELSKHISFNTELKTVFQKIILQFEQFLYIEQADSLEPYLSLYKKTSGELWCQYALLLGHTEEKTLNLIRDAAALYYFIICLQRANTYINEIRCIIPSSYAPQTTLIELKTNSSSNRVTQTELLSPLLQDLIKQLNETYSNFEKKDRLTLQHILILNRLITKTSEEILQDGCHLLYKKITLTPIRKLWIALCSHISIKHF